MRMHLIVRVHCTSLSAEELPKVSVSKPTILQRGADFTIVCNLTKAQYSSTTLERISWFKDSRLKQSVRNPDSSNPENSLGPLVIRYAGVRDGGSYTCLLQALLRNTKKYNVSDTTMIRSEWPWLRGLTVYAFPELT